MNDRRPLLSEDSVIACCLTVVACGFLVFATYQPEAAMKMAGGAAAIGGCLLVLVMVR